MTSRGPEIRFRCDEDCIQSGCPGHTVRASYNHTTDTYCLEFDSGKPSAYSEAFDEAHLRARTRAISRINWVGPAKPSLEVLAERERCAKIARTAKDDWKAFPEGGICDEIAAKIMEGGE